MTHCYYCKSTIFIGGKKQGNLRFCGNSCFLKGQYLLLTAQLPNKVVNDKINAVHQGACPKCNKKGSPIDIHTSYKIWSFIVFSHWKNEPQICCRSEEHTSELQSRPHLVCRLLLEKKKKK